MADIVHRVGIRSTPKKVFETLSTIDGLSHWWIVDTKGSAKKGGTILFGFADMKVVESKPNKLVKWKCVKGPKEWLGTELIFELKPKKDRTVVLFTHANWKKPTEFMHHCSTKWATFLLSLRDWLERGEGRPAPYDVKIDVDD
ncbi:MAG TPA: SRPBCC domain-containing protein [Syntrophorhabdales bacterium]|nr:SRPBCC domain-containing protein [Syntrophorhabdales bacterium]